MNTTDNVLVCVTQQKTCERLIKMGASFKEKYSGDLYVIHVAKEGVNFLGNKRESEALEYLFNISKGSGADLTVLRSNNIVESIVDFSKEKEIGHIILGESGNDSKENSIIKEIREKLPKCKFLIMPHSELV